MPKEYTCGGDGGVVAGAGAGAGRVSGLDSWRRGHGRGCMPLQSFDNPFFTPFLLMSFCLFLLYDTYEVVALL